MNEPPVVIPEYGIGGDLVGARRGRRAFRFCVVAVVVLTGVLYLCERYLRHDLAETQYIMALTLEEPSARAILRNVVHREAASKETPTAKYVEALAAIEEEDIVLERYQQAYKLNPNSASLIIGYGCRLFQEQRFKEARERFREAGILPPKNALPRYLEAAALAFSTPGEEGAAEALALVARTNSSGEPVWLPAPLWHPRLPRKGQWYADLRRSVADQCLAPLYQFEARTLDIIEDNFARGDYRDWSSWLDALDEMGRHLTGLRQGPLEVSESAALQPVGVAQVVAGTQFQSNALSVSSRIAERAGAVLGEEQRQRLGALEMALDKVRAFEAAREAEIAQHAAIVTRPLWLSLETGVALYYVLSFVLFVHWTVTGNRRSWPFRIVSLLVLLGMVLLILAPPVGLLLLGVVGAGTLLRAYSRSNTNAWSLLAAPRVAISEAIALGSLLLLLTLLTFTQTLGAAGVTWLTPVGWLWWGTLAITILWGLLFPRWTLPRPGALLARTGVDGSEVAAQSAAIKRGYRVAYVTAMRRYAGVLFGGFLVTLCLWVIIFRIYMGLYPVQIKLLTTGAEALEVGTLRELREVLANSPAPVAITVPPNVL